MYLSLSLQLVLSVLIILNSPDSTREPPFTRIVPSQPHQLNPPVNPHKTPSEITACCGVVMNFQSHKNKAADTQVFIDNAEPDVIIGCDTRLNNEIFISSKQERYREDSRGGILIAVSDDILSSPIYTSANAQLLSVQLQVNRSKFIIVTPPPPPTITGRRCLRNGQ